MSTMTTYLVMRGDLWSIDVLNEEVMWLVTLALASL